MPRSGDEGRRMWKLRFNGVSDFSRKEGERDLQTAVAELVG